MTELPKVMRPDFGKTPLVFLQEVKTELKKVSWPTKEEVIKLTIIVIAISTAVGIYVGGLDLVFTKLTNLLVN